MHRGRPGLEDPPHEELGASVEGALCLGARLGIEEGDEDYWDSLPEEDPRVHVHDIYEWVGYLQETLVRALWV